MGTPPFSTGEKRSFYDATKTVDLYKFTVYEFAVCGAEASMPRLQ